MLVSSVRLDHRGGNMCSSMSESQITHARSNLLEGEGIRL